jgi:hypothetical protein
VNQPNTALFDIAWPLPHTPRLALAAPRLRLPSGARRFAESDLGSLTAWKPEALAGPWGWIASLLEQEERGTLDLASCLTHPLLVVGRPEDGVRGDEDRALVWKRWGLPVFEQWRAEDGTLLAWECEAHTGLHVTPAFEGHAHTREPCPCGQAGARLLVEPQPVALVLLPSGPCPPLWKSATSSSTG